MSNGRFVLCLSPWKVQRSSLSFFHPQQNKISEMKTTFLFVSYHFIFFLLLNWNLLVQNFPQHINFHVKFANDHILSECPGNFHKLLYIRTVQKEGYCCNFLTRNHFQENGISKNECRFITYCYMYIGLVLTATSIHNEILNLNYIIHLC